MTPSINESVDNDGSRDSDIAMIMDSGGERSAPAQVLVTSTSKCAFRTPPQISHSQPFHSTIDNPVLHLDHYAHMIAAMDEDAMTPEQNLTKALLDERTALKAVHADSLLYTSVILQLLAPSHQPAATPALVATLPPRNEAQDRLNAAQQAEINPAKAQFDVRDVQAKKDMTALHAELEVKKAELMAIASDCPLSHPLPARPEFFGVVAA
jgi:hypothetical protein